MTFNLSHYFEKIKVDSCDSFTYNRKNIDLHVIILQHPLNQF